MVLSMTGYGKAHHDTENTSILVELKTLNAKYADIHLKLPGFLQEKEHAIRSLLKENLERGKITCTIDITEKKPSPEDLALNKGLFKAYYYAMDTMADELNAEKSEIFKLAIQAPDVMKPNGEEEVIPETWEWVEKNIQEAIDQCKQFRQQEGTSIGDYLKDCTHEIKAGLHNIQGQVTSRNSKIKEKLQVQVKELLSPEDYDQNRFEQELIYYIEKFDINEEIVRLNTHADYFLEVLNASSSQGKKLGFIAQEMGREINTIGSKANDANIQREVVTMKEELEKIKEQLLNII